MVTSTATLSFENIGMTFPDGTEALRDVSFSVDRGEFVTIVGPSGCGKSTLLKIASGLLDQTSGTVAVDRERIGYVFQDATLLQWRTVQRNVELFAELHEQGRTIVMVTHNPEIAARIPRVVELRDGAIVKEDTHPQEWAY